MPACALLRDVAHRHRRASSWEFLLLFQASGDYGFDQLSRAGDKLPAGRRNAVFPALPVWLRHQGRHGPLHIWLRPLIPVAPSNVSAMMSGCSSKPASTAWRACFSISWARHQAGGCDGVDDRTIPQCWVCCSR